MAMDRYLDEKERRAVVRRTTTPHTTKEQPTMDSKDGTEKDLDRGQLLLHTHELESRCLLLRRQLATLRGYSDAEVREMVGDEMLSLAGIRRRLGT